MATFSSKYTNRIPQFIQKFNTGKELSLEQIGILGEDNIKSETPVDKGALKASNQYRIEGDDVIFYNDEDYASHVELGTVNQSANPFVRRGLAKSQFGFLNILVKNFRV